jgi:hypothetical protein
MPALRDLQSAFGRALLQDARAQPVPRELALDGLAVGIYRNTCFGTLSSALGLSFPAVRRLVGAEFFDHAAREFVRTHAPASAYLNDYGREFPAFVAQFAPAGSLAYLADVAQLEWAVNRALHAADAAPLDLAALAAVDAALVPNLSFVPHPAVSVLQLAAPADAIWRAVLDQDQAAMAALDPLAGPVWLLLDRSAHGVQVRRMAPAAWRFTQRLCAGEPLQTALDEPRPGTHSDEQLNAVLADHLASGRFTSWRIHGDLVS